MAGLDDLQGLFQPKWSYQSTVHFCRASEPQHCWLPKPVGRSPAGSVSPVALHWMEGECHTAVSCLGTAHPQSISSFSWGNSLCSGNRELNFSSVFALAVSRVATAGGHRFAQTAARRLKIKTIFIY